MKFKTTILLLLVAIAAAYYIINIDSKKLSTEELKRIEKRIFKQFRPEQITRIQLTVTKTGEVEKVQEVELKREVAGWNLVKPVNFPADAPKIRYMLDGIKKIDQSQILVGDDYKNFDKKNAGLEKPPVIAMFETPSTSVTFRIGGDDPIRWNHYVKIAGRDSIYIVPAHFKDSLKVEFDNTLEDFRRRDVFSAKKYSITSLTLDTPNSSLELKRDDLNMLWKVIDPVVDFADEEKIQKMIDKIVAMRVDEFIETPTNIGKTSLTLGVTQGPVSQRLKVSKKVENQFQARRAEYQQYFTLSENDVNLFLGKPNDYRSKLLIIQNIFEEAVHLTQNVNGGIMEFDLKDKEWYIPGLKTPLQDDFKVEDYVDSWQEITISNFADNAIAKKALSNVWVTLIFKYKGLDETKTIKLSRPKNGLVYAERSEGVFVTLSEKALKSFIKTDDLPFITDDIVDIPYEKIKEVTLKSKDVLQKFNLSSNRWVYSVSNIVRETMYDIASDLDDLLPIMSEKCVADSLKISESKIKQFGFELPYQTYSFKTENNKTASLIIGAETPKTNRFAMVKGETYVFELSKETVEDLNMLFEF